jgi:hypothetical protein
MSTLRRGLLARPMTLAGIAVLGGLAACSAFEPPEPPPPCPEVATVDDAAKLTRFAGEGRDLTDVAFEAEVGQLSGSCVTEDDVIDVELQVQFIASRGPADKDRRADFRYFVAVARTDQTIIAREEFDSYIEFPGNQTRAAIVEELAQHIPRVSGETGETYVIYVGFALTHEEVEFNRAQR